MNNYKELKSKLDSLAVFSALKQDPVIAALGKLLEELSVSAYSEFVAQLYPYGADLSAYVKDAALSDENFYVKKAAAGEKIDSEIIQTVKHELEILDELAAVSPEEISITVSAGHPGLNLPSWRNSPTRLLTDFSAKMSDIGSSGYGIFAKYNFFRVAEGEIVPVKYPDFQPLDRFFEYERERNLIIRNTEALIDGSGASNMLLYGDMGTGKSSTIKAVAAAFADRGLRLIEIKKNQLFQVPEIMDQLAANPLKFILFIDDLSFAGNDDNFSALKAILEGSISGCGNNTVIYATSNRRHLIRESAADRTGGAGVDDDLHVNDTLQETMSLAARFGLSITFGKPGRDEYLSIVRSLADKYGIAVVEDDAEEIPEGALTEAQLFTKAEAFAIRRNGRSPRTARQFIELLNIGI